jgi:hypothetical protein
MSVPPHVQEIPAAEVHYHSASYCDSRGRVFWWKRGLYRGITAPHSEFYMNLFKSGVVQHLMDQNMLVETETTNCVAPDFPLVVKHRAVPFVSYANEWCPQMLRDAGLLLLDIVDALLHHDLLLTSANRGAFFLTESGRSSLISATLFRFKRRTGSASGTNTAPTSYSPCN